MSIFCGMLAGLSPSSYGQWTKNERNSERDAFDTVNVLTMPERVDPVTLVELEFLPGDLISGPRLVARRIAVRDKLKRDMASGQFAKDCARVINYYVNSKMDDYYGRPLYELPEGWRDWDEFINWKISCWLIEREKALDFEAIADSVFEDLEKITYEPIDYSKRIIYENDYCSSDEEFEDSESVIRLPHCPKTPRESYWESLLNGPWDDNQICDDPYCDDYRCAKREEKRRYRNFLSLVKEYNQSLDTIRNYEFKVSL